MHRLLILVAAIAVLLGIAAPAALAAEPAASSRSFVLSVDRDVDVPAGDHIETLVVVRGDANVAGSVDSLVIVDGTATLTAATAGSLVVVNGTADLGSGSTVTGDVRTYSGTVNRASDAVVGGTVRAADTDLAAFALLLIPLFLVLLVGFGVAALAVALLVAAFGARQVRRAESLISDEPGTVLVAGIVGSVVLPILALLATVTIVGAPLGPRRAVPGPAHAGLHRLDRGRHLDRRLDPRTLRRPARRAALRRGRRRGVDPGARRHRAVRQRDRDAVRVRRPAGHRVADPPPAHGVDRRRGPQPADPQRGLGMGPAESRTRRMRRSSVSRSLVRPPRRRASRRAFRRVIGSRR